MINTPVDEVALLGRKLRAEQHTVVFTNGVFDILHAGHVTYLEHARSLGTILVVGVNDDASVTRLKGPTRPVNTLDDRMTVLRALRSVDFVYPFSEDTPIELITALLPHVLVKGADYSRDTVVGADVVEQHGGKVVLVPLVEGRSTTNIINRAQKA
ncbi:MAG: D-glycero-beta-D-manno-heptose 1-phosphate adenylyltransferase [Bradyrhizobiaceae bacterium]|nr:D-glycero-beta-D-manno-heptose 1-phosphate adenylyltransferase [Bradyrhizobiaceae bacterium]